MPKKVNKNIKTEKNESFTFRVKLGEREIELKGLHKDVTHTIEKLPNLISNIYKAFDNMTPKTVTTLTVKTKPSSSKPEPKESSQEYPQISTAKGSKDAILEILQTNWGKWRPRTMEELQEAIISNNLKFTKTILKKTINQLVKKGKIRRWSTNAGFVYILTEEKPVQKEGKKK